MNHKKTTLQEVNAYRKNLPTNKVKMIKYY